MNGRCSAMLTTKWLGHVFFFFFFFSIAFYAQSSKLKCLNLPKLILFYFKLFFSVLKHLQNTKKIPKISRNKHLSIGKLTYFGAKNFFDLWFVGRMEVAIRSGCSRIHGFWNPLSSNQSQGLREILSILKFCDLLTTTSWNKELIEQHFWQVDRELIWGIPLSTRARNDLLIWHYESKGSYSVKSGYRLEMDTRQLGSCSEDSADISWWR